MDPDSVWRSRKMAEDDAEEINRIAYELWVLAKMPASGPESFLDEAQELVARRKQHRESACGGAS